MFSIDRMQRADVEATAQLLTDVFLDNPCYAFMHPRVASRRRDLSAFFLRNLRWREPLGLTWVARSQSGAVAGTATLQPPGGVRRGFLPTIRHWVVPTLREQGVETLARIARMEREFASQEQRVAKGARYWYVHAVAVRPDLQSRGLGTSLMHTLLGELATARRAEEPSEPPLVLATQEPQNLAFYARLGFRLRREARMGKTRSDGGFVSWFMRYEPSVRDGSA